MTNATLTHRRHNNTLTGYVMYFAEDEDRNRHYGQHVWTLETELPAVPEAVIEFAAEYHECSADEIRDEVDVPDIVNHAGVWEDTQFCYECWERFGEAGYRTQDGAVVLDAEGVKLSYHFDDE